MKSVYSINFGQRLMLSLILMLVSLTSYASESTGLPWESTLDKILASLTGPVSKVLGVIAIVLAGFGIAFGESGGTLRKVFQIVMGLSIAFTASSLVVSLFGFSSGAVF